MERRIQLEALAVAFPLTVVLLMVLGLVELATPLSGDDWSYRHVWAFLPILYTWRAGVRGSARPASGDQSSDTCT